MSETDTQRKIEILMERLTPERRGRFTHALSNRTRRLTLVLEDVFQPHNAAAVMRSCDAFGLQDVHVIESRYLLDVSPQVDLGVSKWLDIHRHTSKEARGEKRGIPKTKELTSAGNKNVEKALRGLKARGYTLAAATLREDAKPLEEIPVDKPLALMIGTELTGLSLKAHDMADEYFSLPMLGFSQSLNLSVFSAICLKDLSARMRAHSAEWKLPKAEADELLLKWLMKSVSGANELIRLEE